MSLSNIELLKSSFKQYEVLFVVANVIIVFSTISVIFAVIVDFVMYHKPRENKKKVNSWVETGSMFAFFFCYFFLLQLKWGQIHTKSSLLINACAVVGSVMMIVGCYFNIRGRFSLKGNWANQVTIYHHHSLVTTGVYGVVRHPLYASIIWMLLAGSLIYLDFLALISVVVIFIPMMHYRASQEESLLQTEFPEYKNYKNKVGLFFPIKCKHDKL